MPKAEPSPLNPLSTPPSVYSMPLVPVSVSTTDQSLREGRLRRDRVGVVVNDALTTDDDRSGPTCSVPEAAADAGEIAASSIGLTTGHGGAVTTGDVALTAADTG